MRKTEHEQMDILNHFKIHIKAHEWREDEDQVGVMVAFKSGHTVTDRLVNVRQIEHSSLGNFT